MKPKILYHIGDHSVMLCDSMYVVFRPMKNDPHYRSVTDSAYRMDADGLSLAKARVDYLAKVAGKLTVYD